MTGWYGLATWTAVIGSAWVGLVPDLLSASSLVVVALAVPSLVFGASVLRRAHALEPSIRESRARADARAAATAALLARLK